MSNPEPTLNSPAIETGLFGMPSSLLLSRIGTPSARLALAAVLALAGLFALAAPALAASTRELQSQVIGATPPSAPVQGPFEAPRAIAIGPSNSLWVVDANRAVISAYGSDGAYLSEQTGSGHLGADLDSLALNDATGFLYIGENGEQSRPSFIKVFDGSGAFSTQFEYSNDSDEVAIDNSGGAGGPGEGEEGRLYVANGRGGTVRAFSPSLQEHPFSESAPYIAGSTITGTPAGPFNGANQMTVDAHGNLFVVDRFNGVAEFEPSGKFVREFTGEKVPGGFSSGNLEGVAIDPTNGNVLILDGGAGEGVIDEFNSAGKYLGQIRGPTESEPFAETLSESGIATDSAGYLYVTQGHNNLGEGVPVVDRFLPAGLLLPTVATAPAANIERTSATLNGEVAPNGAGEKIADCHFEYVASSEYRPWEANPYAAGSVSPCLESGGGVVGTVGVPITAATAVHADVTGLRAGVSYHWRLSATGDKAGGASRRIAGAQFQTPPAVDSVETGTSTEITNESATLHGSFVGDGNDTSFYFEYGTSTNYGHRSPVVDQGTSSGSQEVSAPIAGLIPNGTYHYRLVAENQFGAAAGEDRTFVTLEAPTIEAVSSSGLSASGALLHARINPNGFTTTYRFEYGTTLTYGESTSSGEIATELGEGHEVEAQLEDLQVGATYHFRVIAENRWGTVTSEDQTFEFLPPNCPNAAVRQQTGSAYLPDCRAYELVSPGNAAGTLLFSGGPSVPTATSPSRFAYVGAFSALPGATNTINTAGDLYVATRTNTGWVSNYIGLGGNEAGCMGLPPNNSHSHASEPDKIQNGVVANSNMSQILDWNDGDPIGCISGTNGVQDANGEAAVPSSAPYLWSAGGELLEHLPSGVSEDSSLAAALSCPTNLDAGYAPLCSGDIAASSDLSHVAFSLTGHPLTAGAPTAAPGSAYDYDVQTHAFHLISTLPGGEPIPQDPLYSLNPHASQEFIRFPAISANGSHILMSTATSYSDPTCENGIATPCPGPISTPVHLYISVDDVTTYAIAPGSAVSYVGATPDGTRVYFTSTEQLTGEDHDSSTDLYMWSEEGQVDGHPLTLLSKGDNPGNVGEPGNSDSCSTSWTAKCGIQVYSTFHYSALQGNTGGNGTSDNSIAADNGDIYFYSPEQLDGDHGVLGEENLYDFRHGEVRFVTTLEPGHVCTPDQSESVCSDGPIARLQVSPNDAHMAFITASRLTAYENAGHAEMYSYTPATGAIVCDSCLPSGQSPTADVFASQDGLFMSDDGRTFFTTTDALVPRDTNEAQDVYEFVDGRPQLISAGTGTATVGTGGLATGGNTLVNVAQKPGLVGVSANGTDVYFSTYDSLVAEDQNGSFLKFYDARTDGGFVQPTPVPPCSAAEECHGAGSSAPEQPTQGTSAQLSNGNVVDHRPAKHKKHRKTHKRSRTDRRAVVARRGGVR